MAENITSYLNDAVLFVNTTSLGMKNEKIPLVSFADMPSTTKIYDMVYAPVITPLLRDATERGFCCANGLGMLAGQGELAFWIWTAVTPPCWSDEGCACKCLYCLILA